MARVVALYDDLLLGSNVLGHLRAGGHDAHLVADPALAREAVTSDLGADVLVVDLASAGFDGAAFASSLIAGGEAGRTKLLGVHSHVDVEQKRRGEAAGFDLVIPRSRMAREGAAVVDGLVRPAP